MWCGGGGGGVCVCVCVCVCEGGNHEDTYVCVYKKVNVYKLVGNQFSTQDNKTIKILYRL